MADQNPKWRRRKEARPGEIVDAALEVFAEKGFAAAKLDDIARRAGISKATLSTSILRLKEEIFHALRGPRSRRSLKRSKARLRLPLGRSPNSHPGSCRAPQG